MENYIILLRGVMPTGKNKVLMQPLRAALETAGLENVQTYIQSGNILAASSLCQSDIEKLVHDVIETQFGGDLVVLARTISQFRNVLSQNPFGEADPSKLYISLLAAKPDQHVVEEFLAPGYLPDQVAVVDDVVYVLCATNYSDVKATNNYIERKLGVRATTRIYNTIAKLVQRCPQE
jgi:uncharacterized protein (DUF1697 family)